MDRVSFHSFPDINTDKGKLWIAKIRRDPGHDFVVNKYTNVCSLHFRSAGFSSVGMYLNNVPSSDFNFLQSVCHKC